jgi:AcrR family transcriptional regulator
MQFLMTNAEKKKSNILEATFSCIYEQGIAGMTMRSIAKKAKLFQPALYYYFKNKNILLTEFIRIMFDRMIYDVEKRYKDSDPPEQKLECIFEAGKDFFQKQKESFVVFIDCWSLCVRDQTLSKLLSELYKKFLKVFKNVIEEGKKAGVFNEVNEDAISVLIISFVQGISLLHWHMRDKECSRKLIEDYALFTINLRGLILRSPPNFDHKNNYLRGEKAS